MIDELNPTIRYSPKPLEEYPRTPTGPAGDSRVDRVTVWNLAYLSHDFDRFPLHKDPHFLTHVRRSCQYDLETGAVDLAGWAKGGVDLLDNKLLMPAPWFVNWLMKNRRVMINLPLFKAYGQSWVSAIEERCRICHTHGEGEPEDLLDLSVAKGVLLRFTRR